MEVRGTVVPLCENNSLALLVFYNTLTQISVTNFLSATNLPPQLQPFNTFQVEAISFDIFCFVGNRGRMMHDLTTMVDLGTVRTHC